MFGFFFFYFLFLCGFAIVEFYFLVWLESCLGLCPELRIWFSLPLYIYYSSQKLKVNALTISSVFALSS
jgi:hypothetical protein